jgi:hypothetical protein
MRLLEKHEYYTDIGVRTYLEKMANKEFLK